jgi:hypothetical protein
LFPDAHVTATHVHLAFELLLAKDRLMNSSLLLCGTQIMEADIRAKTTQSRSEKVGHWSSPADDF